MLLDKNLQHILDLARRRRVKWGLSGERELRPASSRRVENVMTCFNPKSTGCAIAPKINAINFMIATQHREMRVNWQYSRILCREHAVCPPQVTCELSGRGASNIPGRGDLAMNRTNQMVDKRLMTFEELYNRRPFGRTGANRVDSGCT